jgi:hypothetical protein
MNTTSERHERIVTIGQVPFAAGAVMVRNEMRALRRRRNAQRWQRLSRLFRRQPAKNLVTSPPAHNLAFGRFTLRRAN